MKNDRQDNALNRVLRCPNNPTGIHTQAIPHRRRISNSSHKVDGGKVTTQSLLLTWQRRRWIKKSCWSYASTSLWWSSKCNRKSPFGRQSCLKALSYLPPVSFLSRFVDGTHTHTLVLVSKRSLSKPFGIIIKLSST